MKQVIHTYRTVLHGQEVEVRVYEPAEAEDMVRQQGVPTHEDVACDEEDAEEPDLYDDLSEKSLWRRLAEEDDE